MSKTVTTDDLRHQIEEHKRAAAIAAAQTKIGLGQLAEMRLKSGVLKAEEKLAKTQEAIVALEKKLTDLKKTEAEQEANLAKSDEALAAAAKKVEAAETTLHQLKG